MTGQLDLLEEAERARDRGLRRATAATDDSTRRLIDQAILAVIEERGIASMNDCRDLLPEIGDRSKIGARLRALAMSKRIIPVGEVRSTDPGTHAKKILTYRLATPEDVAA